jgi:cell wall assembly regulator SMI1
MESQLIDLTMKGPGIKSQIIAILEQFESDQEVAVNHAKFKRCNSYGSSVSHWEVDIRLWDSTREDR